MIKIIFEKILEDYWITKEESDNLTDEQIIDLIKEDIGSFFENGSFKVVRNE